MKKRLAGCLLVFCSIAIAQPEPVPLRVTRLLGVTATTVIDNRNSATRQNDMHTFCSTGSGTWSVKIQYSSVASTGPWSDFTNSASTVSNSSTTCIGLAYGYYDYIRLLVTGTATTTYAGVKQFYVPTDTSGSGGVLTSLNGLTAADQLFATGTAGSDFGISSATATHTFNIPSASASARGLLLAADYSTFNNKQSALTNSAGLAAALSDETGSGFSVFSAGPTIDIPNFGVRTIGGTLEAPGIAGRFVIVTNGAASGDCIAGGGSTWVICTDNGSAWVHPGGGISVALPIVRTGDTLSCPTCAVTSGTYSNPSWITALAWAKITGAPTFADTAGSYADPSWITSLAWSKITSPPAVYVGTNGVVGIGGATASFPGLKNSTTILQARLADDSTFAKIQAAAATVQNDVVTLDSTSKIDVSLIPDLPASRITTGTIAAANGGLGVDASAFNGVMKWVAGVPTIITGTASDCIKVDASSGACGSGSSGAGTAFSQEFASATTWTVTGASHGQGTCHFVVQTFEDQTTTFKEIRPDAKVCDKSTYDVTVSFNTAKAGLLVIGTGTTIVGAYSADKTSATTWTVTGATHLLGTCDLSINPYTVSGSTQTKIIPATVSCNTSTKDVTVTFDSAKVGRITLLKSGGAGSGGGGGGTGTLESLNGQTGATQTFAAGVAGSDFNIVSGSNVHTFNLPDATTTARGAITTVAQGFLGRKTFNVSASDAGLNVGSTATAPSVPINGDIWYDSTLAKFRCRENSATTDCIAAGSLPSPTGNGDKILGANAGGTGYELKAVNGGSAISVTYTVGGITISVRSSQVCFTALDCAFLGHHQYNGKRSDIPRSGQVLVAGTAIIADAVMTPISAAGNITLTATPTIADGIDGQQLIVFQTSAFTINLQGEGSLAGSNICGPNIASTQGRWFELRYSQDLGCWMQKL